jgi:hypothetical protein
VGQAYKKCSNSKRSRTTVAPGAAPPPHIPASAAVTDADPASGPCAKGEVPISNGEYAFFAWGDRRNRYNKNKVERVFVSAYTLAQKSVTKSVTKVCPKGVKKCLFEGISPPS